MITDKQRDYLKNVMGLNERRDGVCPRCGKKVEVMVIVKRRWLCQECAELYKTNKV
jgi:ribosomal protein S27AE